MRGPCKILMEVRKSADTISKCPLVIYIRYNGLSYQDPYRLNHFEIMTDILIQKWWKYAYLFQNKVDIMLYFKVQGDSREFMGKTFQAAQLAHERFLTIDHSCKIFFWYSCNNITTTLIQISRLFYFGFFSKTNHQMII